MSIKEECRKKRAEGKSIRLVAKELGVSASTVRFHTKDIEVETSQKVQWAWSDKRYKTMGILQRDRFPDRLKYSNDLAYLFGIYLGDGCYSGSKFILSCGHAHPQLEKRWVDAVKKGLGVEPHVLPKKGCKSSEIYLYEHKDELGKIGKLMDIENGEKTYTCRVPDWIKRSRSYSLLCLRGLMESDGHIHHCFKKGGWYWASSFCSVSIPLRADVIEMSESIGLSPKERGNNVHFGSKDTQTMMRLIGLDKTIEYVY